MGMLWYGYVMVMLWYGYVMVMLSYGMVMLWSCYGMVMLWSCYGMVMLWYVVVLCCVTLRVWYDTGFFKNSWPPHESLFFLKADGYNPVWYNFEVGYGMVSMNGYLCMDGYVWCGMIYHVMFCYVSMDGWIHLSSKILLLSLPFPSRFEGDYRSWWWATCHLTARGAAWSDVR